MKIWKSILFGILASILLVVIVLSIIAGKRYRENIKCSGIQIEILDGYLNGFIVKEEIKELLDKEYGRYVGDFIDSLNLVKIEKIVGTKSAVKDVKAYVSKDGLLNIKVTQQKPIARLQTRSGGYYVNENGGLFPLQRNYTSHVLVIDGDISKNPNAEWMTKLVSLVKVLKDENKWKNNIVQINVRNRGELVLIPREGREKFLIGQPIDIDEKLKRIETYYSHIQPNTEDKNYEYIDVRYDKQIICK